MPKDSKTTPKDSKKDAVSELGAAFDKFSITAKRPRTRLIVGDADFSYTTALIKKHKKKHPDLAANVVATAYESKATLKETYANTLYKHVKFLTKNGVKLFAKVDGTKLHQSKNLAGKHFERIHFNFPHDKSRYEQQTLPPIIADFFKSAAHLQQAGDRIHMALPKPANPATQAGKPAGDYNKFYKGLVYNVYDAARNAGYRLVIKRKFGTDRYPGYKHVMTGQHDSAAVAESGREYIFEKTNLTPTQILQQDREDKERAPILKYFWLKTVMKEVPRYCVAEIATDNDSSDYETDQETTAPNAAPAPRVG